MKKYVDCNQYYVGIGYIYSVLYCLYVWSGINENKKVTCIQLSINCIRMYVCGYELYMRDSNIRLYIFFYLGIFSLWEYGIVLIQFHVFYFLYHSSFSLETLRNSFYRTNYSNINNVLIVPSCYNEVNKAAYYRKKTILIESRRNVLTSMYNKNERCQGTKLLFSFAIIIMTCCTPLIQRNIETHPDLYKSSYDRSYFYENVVDHSFTHVRVKRKIRDDLKVVDPVVLKTFETVNNTTFAPKYLEKCKPTDFLRRSSTISQPTLNSLHEKYIADPPRPLKYNTTTTGTMCCS